MTTTDTITLDVQTAREIEAALAAFDWVAQWNKANPEGTSVFVNISRCRDASAALSKLREKLK